MTLNDIIYKNNKTCIIMVSCSKMEENAMKRFVISIIVFVMIISIGGCTEQDISTQHSSSSSSIAGSELDESHKNYEMGVNSYNNKDYQQAKQKLSKVIPKDNNYDDAQRMLREIETLEQAKNTTQMQSSTTIAETTTEETSITLEETTPQITTSRESTTSETESVRDYSEPVFDTAYASSTLKPISSNGTVYTYDAKNVLDNDNGTCWCESADGTGGGEMITLTAENPQNVGKIIITNGLCSDRESFYKNSRVKDCRITFSDGTSFEYTLSGEYGEQPTVINFNSNMVTTYIKLTILSTYPGSKYSDTCISEIKASL